MIVLVIKGTTGEDVVTAQETTGRGRLRGPRTKMYSLPFKQLKTGGGGVGHYTLKARASSFTVFNTL
jgi:hypothetical protein